MFQKKKTLCWLDQYIIYATTSQGNTVAVCIATLKLYGTERYVKFQGGQ